VEIICIDSSGEAILISLDLERHKDFDCEVNFNNWGY
jgi:hypothetical protein